MYRPNFCADCGERVERRRWRVWTSRRFCVKCERRLGRGRFARAALLCALLVAVGFALGRAGRERSAPLVIERAEFADAAATREGVMDSGGAAEREGADGAAAKKVAPAYGPDGTEGERPTDPNEVVSMWAVVSVLRGIVNPLLDRRMERDAKLQGLVVELDARAGEEQPTTA